MTKRTIPILPEFVPQAIIEGMLSLLNAKTARNEIESYCISVLRGYAQSWIDAEYKVEKWPYRKELLEDVKAADLWLVAGSSGQPQFLPVPRFHSLTPEEAAEIQPNQTDEERDLAFRCDGRAMASRLFAEFITSPYYAELHRCGRCQKFFVNMRGHRNKKYCSIRCAHHATAVKATRERFEKERQDKLDRINEAIARLGGRADRSKLLPKWKQWVANHAEVDIRFLTRVTNKGQLLLPDWIPAKYRS